MGRQVSQIEGILKYVYLAVDKTMKCGVGEIICLFETGLREYNTQFIRHIVPTTTGGPEKVY